METTIASGTKRLDKATLRQLAKADRRRVVVRTVCVLGIYGMAVGVSLYVGFGIVSVLMSMICGFVLAGFLNAAHDCVHRSHLRSKRGNRIMGAIWSVPVLQNFSVYHYQHLVHHRYTGVEGDTEPPRKYTSLISYLYSLTGIALWRHTLLSIARGMWNDFPKSINSERRRAEAQQDNWALVGWLVLTVALTVFFPYIVVLVYWLPLAFSAPAVILLALPEHYGLWGTSDGNRNTRTVRSNRVARFLLWNANYHAEHHHYPAVPTLNLYRLHKSMPEPHPVQERSYLGFHYRLIRAIKTNNGDIKA